MKGIDKVEHHPFIGGVLIFAGLLVIVFSIKHNKIESKFGKIKYFVFGVESVVMALIGYSYYQDRSNLLHYAYFIVSLMFIAAIPISYFLHDSQSKKVSRKIVSPEESKEGILNSIAPNSEKN
ncbi:MAG: hypothetical protein Q8S39_09210 [Ignavibacteria bacterium]|nr:hypothetical protein [Ignavibacteria bacterium]